MNAQLNLFEASAPSAPRRLGGGPPCVELMWERARSPDVEIETLAIAAARPDEWLSWNDFRAVIEKHKIGSCFGHILFGYVRAGKLLEKKVYNGKGIGAEQPGSENYRGYYCKWRAA